MQKIKAIFCNASEQTNSRSIARGLTLETVLSLVVLGLFSTSTAAQTSHPKADWVQLEAATSNTFVVKNARLMLKHNVVIAARESGIVVSIPNQEGEVVGKNDTLMQLDQKVYEAQLEVAIQQRRIAGEDSANDVDVRYAKKSAAVNQKVLTRSAQAAKAYDKSVSQTELGRLQLELDRSQLSAEQAEHSRKIKELTYGLREAEQRLAEIRLAERTILSPIGGQVAEVLVQQGQFVTSGQPLVRVISLTQLKVEVFVKDDNASSLNTGQRVKISTMKNGKEIEKQSSITYVSPEIDPLNGDVRIVVEVNNDDRRLKPGMLVDLAF